VNLGEECEEGEKSKELEDDEERDVKGHEEMHHDGNRSGTANQNKQRDVIPRLSRDVGRDLNVHG